MGNVAQDKDEYVPMEQNDGLYYRNFPNISRVLTVRRACAMR